VNNSELVTHLAKLRASIDARDVELVRVLASRFELTRKVGELKATYDLPPRDSAREAEHLACLKKIAVEARLDPEFILNIFDIVMAQVVNDHQIIRRNN
jgi:chorismate mutase